MKVLTGRINKPVHLSICFLPDFCCTRDEAERENSDCISPFVSLYCIFLLMTERVWREAQCAALALQRPRRNALNEKRRIGVAKEGRV